MKELIEKKKDEELKKGNWKEIQKEIQKPANKYMHQQNVLQ